MDKIIIICMLGALIVLCILILAKSGKKDSTKTILSAIERAERNTAGYSSLGRKEITSQFTQLSRLTLDNISSLCESNEKSVEKLYNIVDARLGEIRRTVDEKLTENLKNGLDDSFAKVSSQLSQLYQSMGEVKTLTSDIGDLKGILSNVKNRGTWGEIQLLKLIEDMMAPEQYTANARINGNVVEFAVVLPGEDEKILLPIDSKFPMDRYYNVVSSTGEENTAFKKELFRALCEEAKKISTKYIFPPKTTDFAIMFLPSEGLYATAIELGLLEEARTKYKVMITGPSTLSALLTSLQTGFKTLAIKEHSAKILSMLNGIKGEFSKFEDYIEKTKNSLRTAQGHLEMVSKKSSSIQHRLGNIGDSSYIE